MGQDFHVLRCFSCQTFQVQQVKKVNRWSCKLCGQKQSVLKEFGRGSGADCRRHVQKLNAMRGAMMEEEEEATRSLWQQAAPEGGAEEQVDLQVSLWNKYVDPPQGAEPQDPEPDENVVMDRQQLHNNRTNKKRKRANDNWRPEQNTDHLRPDRTSSWTNSGLPRMSRSSSTSLTRTGPRAVNRPGFSSQSTACPLDVSTPDLSSFTRTSGPSGSGPSGSGPSGSGGSGPSGSGGSGPSGSGGSGSSGSGGSGSSGSGSKWTRFLSAVCPKGEELNVGGVISGSGDTPPLPSPSFRCVNNVQQTPPLARPRPLLPVSSLFDSGDDFSFSDMF
ncbi:MRN complex-interacting protein isoform X2 [Sphaeramia orbicularis]|uniref:MRN complex-interacting protein isoform X2 n=1 Tax=Sphaeramia orbicularis TaxID=375764 RepID=UPI00117D8C92|nr:neurogenic protein mastermind-like isoform X2 [Sphaeramia orbicularis]